MDTGEVAIGMRARYGRTGTVGTVTAIQAINGESFAELDSTGLLYRVDQLALAGAAAGERRERTAEEIEKQLQRDREGIYRTDGGQFELDNSCEGGG
jgi:hypothetical protein